MGYPEEEESVLLFLAKKLPTLLSLTFIGPHVFVEPIIGKGNGNIPGAGNEVHLA